MVKPSRTRILKFYKERFPKNYGKDFDRDYMNEWMRRFNSPRIVWGSSDFQTRKMLKKHFPATFGKVEITDNLYNSEFGDKYSKW